MALYDEAQGTLDDSQLSTVNTTDRPLDNREPLSILNKQTPSFKVVINDTEITSSLYRYVSGLEVIDNDDLAPMFRIEFLNLDFSLTNEALLVEGARVQIWTGYAGENLLYRGAFIADKPVHNNMNSTTPSVTLTGLGEISRMGKQKVQKVFANKKDSDIALEIANKYNFDLDADDTGVVYEYVHQANETDIAFLQRRARLYGFQVFLDSGQLIDNNGIEKKKPVLHFHKVRYVESNLDFLYNSGSLTNVFGIKIDVPTHQTNMVFKKTFFNPNTGKLDVITSENSLDDRSLETLNRYKNTDETIGFKRPEEIGKTTIVNTDERNIVNVVGEGDEMTSEETQTMLNAFAQANTYNIRGKFFSYGNESLSSGQSIRLRGLQKFDGSYYVKRIIHRIGQINGQSKSYRCEIDIRSNMYQDQVSSAPNFATTTSSTFDPVVKRGSSADLTGESESEGSFVETDNGTVIPS